MKNFTFNVRTQNPFLIFIAAVLMLAACKKDSKPASPTTEPITVDVIKNGDTITIRGTNFSAVASENIVSFNGVEAIVVSATANELVVIVPKKATTGIVTVTVRGNTTEVGSITITPVLLYGFTATSIGNYQYDFKIVSMDPDSGTISQIADLEESQEKYGFSYITYSAASKEIMGLDYNGWNLVKINVSTKQVSYVPLISIDNKYFEELVIDKANNLYTFKLEYLNNRTVTTLMKVNPVTGSTTHLDTVAIGYGIYDLSYRAATNEIIGRRGQRQIFKYNLNTGDTSTVQISNDTHVEFYDIMVDNQSNVYGYKHDYTNQEAPLRTIVKLDPVSGAQTLVTKVPDTEDIGIDSRMVYVPQLNEILGIWEGQSLYRYNLKTNASSITKLSSTTYFGTFVNN